jgi:hypothetical protein
MLHEIITLDTDHRPDSCHLPMLNNTIQRAEKLGLQRVSELHIPVTFDTPPLPKKGFACKGSLKT